MRAVSSSSIRSTKAKCTRSRCARLTSRPPSQNPPSRVVCYEQDRADVVVVVVGPRLLDASQVDVVKWLKAHTIQLTPCLPEVLVALLRGLRVSESPAPFTLSPNLHFS